MHNLEFDKSVQKNAISMKELHAHPYYEIYFLAEGERFFFLSNTVHKLCAPSLIIIPPHVMHMTQGGPCVRYNVYVMGNALCGYERDLIDSMSLCSIYIAEDDREVLSRILEMGVQASNQQYSERDAEKLKMIFSAYLTLVYENKRNATLGSENSFLAKSEYIPQQYLKIAEYISENYKEKITLDELSKRFFIAKTTLLCNFKKYFGCSPIDFLLNVRITKAEKLLFDTKRGIEEISEACGFSSANYFSLIFKKKRGISPRGYRMKYDSSKSI